ncbi:hypothetical protein PanWU01x14_348620 [Parasponia andersonii]|uniref:Uncharacterized protein n=1 Tax=Parasponia andersonii TaxID=3476 RepID=A0A2P5ABK7_PARAD|nr:hypothetical protein PanWU01x14_348620 [Parasponia andersonii]
MVVVDPTNDLYFSLNFSAALSVARLKALHGYLLSIGQHLFVDVPKPTLTEPREPEKLEVLMLPFINISSRGGAGQLSPCTLPLPRGGGGCAGLNDISLEGGGGSDEANSFGCRGSDGGIVEDDSSGVNEELDGDRGRESDGKGDNDAIDGVSDQYF